MEDVFACSTLFEEVVGRVSQVKSVIKLSACEKSCVRGDGSPSKFQVYFTVEVELERGLFAVTH
jgi:hypothetical protein